MASRLPQLALLVALSTLVVREAPAADNTGAEWRQGKPVAIGDLWAGRLLLEAGKWSHAHKLLERARPANEEERIERLFLLGIAEVRLDRLRAAAQRFEKILTLRPDLTRVRLDLARVYHVLDRDEKARHHFEASLADKLPSSVESAVEAWLDRIDARRRWSVSLLRQPHPCPRRRRSTAPTSLPRWP